MSDSEDGADPTDAGGDLPEVLFLDDVAALLRCSPRLSSAGCGRMSSRWRHRRRSTSGTGEARRRCSSGSRSVGRAAVRGRRRRNA